MRAARAISGTFSGFAYSRSKRSLARRRYASSPLSTLRRYTSHFGCPWRKPGGERPRQYYQLTGEGIRVARLELAQVRAGQLRAPVRLGRAAPGSL